jgi:hypothetical protein
LPINALSKEFIYVEPEDGNIHISRSAVKDDGRKFQGGKI